jgi:hypothetical protein
LGKGADVVKADQDPSIDDIEIQIARTRVRLADTADALAVRLVPPQLVREGAEMLKEFLRPPDGIKLAGQFRVDPMAVGLIGLGVAWLVAENAGLLDRLIPGVGEPAPSSSNPSPTPTGEKPLLALGEENHTGGWFHQAASATQGAFRSVYDRGGTMVGQAGEFIAHPVDSSQKVRQAGGRVVDAVESNPLLLGLAGVALGAAAAMLLPASRRERAIAVQARERMWETAEEVGHRAAAAMRGMAADPENRERLPHERGNDKD